MSSVLWAPRRLDRRLLTLAATEQEQALRVWLVGEFVNQLDGGEPVPWTGPIDLNDRLA